MSFRTLRTVGVLIAAGVSMIAAEARATGSVWFRTLPYVEYASETLSGRAELSYDGLTYRWTGNSYGDAGPGSAYGYVDIPSGRFGLRTSSYGGIEARAALHELLSFNVPGASQDTITKVAVTFRLDGDSGNIWGLENFNNIYTDRFTFSKYYYFYAYGGSAYGAPAPSGVGCSATEGSTGSNYRATCLVDLYGPHPSMSIDQSLRLIAAYTTEPQYADFSHTASAKIVVPEGVTWTSQSGTYLTAGVPEPSAWAMMIAGFGAAGGLLRRRRRAEGPGGLSASDGPVRP